MHRREFLALAVSFLLSRVLTRPLDAIARAIGQFETGRPITGLPVERNDEIGYLAKSFLSMTSRLNSQVDQLKNRELHLDYLAHHDQLTGLPNRILFLDRLVQAIHKASPRAANWRVLRCSINSVPRAMAKRRCNIWTAISV